MTRKTVTECDLCNKIVTASYFWSYEGYEWCKDCVQLYQKLLEQINIIDDLEMYDLESGKRTASYGDFTK